MKTLIICNSTHLGNTKKITEVFARVLDASVLTSAETDPEKLQEYDLIGFGSGIYGGKHDHNLLNLVDRLPAGSGKKVFIFSTSWTGLGQMEKNHKTLRDKLQTKGFQMVGDFSCKGMATFGPLKWFGGVNKGKPDAQELELARMFAEGLRGREV